MRRGSLFSAAKDRHLKKRKNTGISYKRGHFEDNQYVFYEPPQNEDESEEEIFALRQKRKPDDLVEIQLQPGDTLLNIALQYGYSVEELKRINNIHRENEIHARSILKVPSRITETAAVHKLARDREVTSKRAPVVVDTVECSNVRTVSIGDAYRESKLEGNDADAARRFLVAMDRDLARIRENTFAEQHVSNYELTVTHLGMENMSFTTGPLSNGAVNKSDLSWRCVQLLICSIILGFIAPIVYVLYLAEVNGKQDVSAVNGR